MKKLFLFSLVCVFLGACKDDEGPVEPDGGVTNIAIEKKRNPLLFTQYSSKSQAAGGMEVFRKTIEAQYEGRMANISMVSDPNDPFFSNTGDSLSANFGDPSPFSFVLDNEQTSLLDIKDNMDALINLDKPFIGVVHAVTENDSAYIVDVKVKFFKDTVTNFIFVESYMLGNIKAKTFLNGTLDLRQSGDGTLLGNNDDATIWLKDVNTTDVDTSFASKQLFKSGEQFVHDYVVLKNFNQSNVFGTRLSTYTKFGFEFFQGDQIGLKQNPIRNYFLKNPFLDKDQKIDFDFDPKFVTVVWFYDFIEKKYNVVNAFMN